jgi:hypothetical protein
MTRVGPALAALLLSAALAPLGALAPQEREADRPDRATLGVMRRDGLIIPFASVNGTNWTRLWPVTPLALEDPPEGIDRVPRAWWGGQRPRSWRLWKPSGESQPINVLPTLTTVRVQCAERLALRSDYEAAEPAPAIVDPDPKEGLAVGGSVAVEPIEQLPVGSDEGASLMKAIFQDLDRAEDQMVRAVRGANWRHPFDDEARRKLPVRLESWYRSPLEENGWNISFIEAVRSYPAGPDDQGCGLETLFNGWVFSRGPFVQHAHLMARSTYCDRVGALYMLPFARIRARDRSYWVYQMSGHDAEWYAVAEVRPSEARYVVEFPAGSALLCGGR